MTWFTISKIAGHVETHWHAIQTHDKALADLLARVRDLELVVATEAKPRELTPEERRDNRLRIMLDDIRRESQRRQQAAQESQEQASAPGLAPEDTGTATPRLTQQRQRLVRADWALLWAQRHEGDRRRHDVVVALDWLREWADEAGIDDTAVQLTPQDPDWHIRLARQLISGDSPEWRLPMITAIAHVRAALEPASDAPPAPDATQQAAPADLLTLALEQVDRARDGDACTVDKGCRLVYELDIDHCDREHVSQALGYLRQWQCATGAKAKAWRKSPAAWAIEYVMAPVDQLSSAAWAIEYGLRWAHERETCVANAIARLERWQKQAPDDDVISAEILSADAAAEMPTLPPDPTPTQRAGEVIHHLGLAMMGQDPGPLHWVNLARWELQGWPGMEADPALTISAGQHKKLLPAAAGHVASLTCGAPRRHGAHAIACLDEWLRREAQA